MAKKERQQVLTLKPIYFLVALIVAGAFLRLYNLGFNSLWLDEASTYSISSQSFFTIWQSMVGGEFNPPLFYWIEHIMLWFGNNEIILRLLPAMFGIFAIPIFYFIGKEFLNEKTGIIMAALATFSPFLILYSQEARAYSAMLFFISLAFLFYLKGNRWILFGIMCSIAMWIHFYSFVVIFSLILIHLIVYRKKEIIKSVITIGVLCAPLFYEGVKLFLLRTSIAPSFGIQGTNLLIETISELSGFNIAMALIFIIMSIIGIFLLKNKNKSIMLILTIMGIMVVSFILSYKMPMMPRYLIVLAPFFYLAVALAFNKIKTTRIVCAILAILILTSAPFLCSYYTQYSKDDWKGFGGLLQEKTNTGDVVVIVPGYISQPLNYYYNNTTDKTTEVFINSVDDLKKLNSGWVVLTGDATQEEIQWIQNNAKMVGQYGGIYLFILPSPFQ
jgi:mannosyltransferase